MLAHVYAQINSHVLIVNNSTNVTTVCKLAIAEKNHIRIMHDIFTKGSHENCIRMT